VCQSSKSPNCSLGEPGEITASGCLCPLIRALPACAGFVASLNCEAPCAAFVPDVQNPPACETTELPISSPR
jgi:hypothetical protein